MILAARRDRGTIRVHDIAQEEGLPEKFLQSILLELKNARMIESVRGAKGGYELRRDPKDLRLSEIIRLVDGPQTQFEGTDFLSKGLSPDRRHQALYQVFIDLRDASARILDNTTLADLIPEPICELSTRPATLSDVHPRRSQGRTSPLMITANSLAVGESLFVTLDQWTATGLQSDPAQLVQASSYHPRSSLRGKRFSTKKQETGWLITRKF